MIIHLQSSKYPLAKTAKIIIISFFVLFTITVFGFKYSNFVGKSYEIILIQHLKFNKIYSCTLVTNNKYKNFLLTTSPINKSKIPLKMHSDLNNKQKFTFEIHHNKKGSSLYLITNPSHKLKVKVELFINCKAIKPRFINHKKLRGAILKRHKGLFHDFAWGEIIVEENESIIPDYLPRRIYIYTQNGYYQMIDLSEYD